MYKSKEEIVKLCLEYEKGKLAPSDKEKLIVHPAVAYQVTDSDILESIPFDELRKLENIYGRVSRFSQYTPVKNLRWDYFHFTDPSVFMPAATAFKKSMENVKGTKIKPCYTKHLPGTKAYRDFWAEEYNRIKKGFEPEVNGKKCGIRISGEFYFYLNYGWIKKIELDDEGNVLSDKSDLPDFLAMDYYYYRELESRENPALFGLPRTHKQSLSVTKSRRKGFSYKAAAGAVWITAFRKGAKVLIASAQGKDAALCFKKAMDMIDHISKYTPFGRENPGKPAENGGWKYENMSSTEDSGHFIFGLYNTRTGEKAGRRSEISTASLYNKPDAASGEGLSRLYFEEGGKIDDLGKAWSFSKESLRVGSVYRDGIAILFGTGGEMTTNSGRNGSSKDFSLIHNNPGPNGFAAFDNIYDYKPSEAKCGYFVCDMWYNPGSQVTIGGKTYEGIDRQGNAFFWVAELHLNTERMALRPPNGKKKRYEEFLTQRCKTPGEAFLESQGSRFQTEDLHQRQTEILTSRGGFEQLRTPGELIEVDSRIEFVPKHDLEPIVTTGVDNNDREGCLIRYEPPQKMNGVVPDGAYIISVDPIGIDTSAGRSCSAIIVFKTSRYATWIGEEKIVATYYGRKKINPQEYVSRLLLKLSRYYNAMVTVENDRDGGIPQYFMRKNESHRLMGPPLTTMEKFIPGTKTTLRKFGHSMGSEAHKTVGEDLLYEWLDIRNGATTYYDTESGESIRTNGLRNLDRLQDQLLLEQLQAYNRNGNYDMVMAMMGIVVQLKEWYDVEDTYEEATDISDELSDWFEQRYMSEDEKHYAKSNKNRKDKTNISKFNKVEMEDDY
jgi:hypothetical protein